VTLISAFEFNEAPWGGPIALAEPELHGKFTDFTKTVAANVVYGVATKVANTAVEVTPLGGGASFSIPFDFLVAATGFKMPTILPTPGESWAARSAHVGAVYKAATSGGHVVVAGGGLIGVELAGNLCEALAKAKSGGRVTLVASSDALLPGYPVRVQASAKATLERLGATVVCGAKVTSHAATTLAPSAAAPFDVALSSGTTVGGVACFVPSFAARAETAWLEGAPGVALDPNAGYRVVVDAHLCGASNPGPQVFALGGCAALKEPWLGAPKMVAQAKTVAANLVRAAKGQPLKLHQEGEPAITMPPVVQVGRHTWVALVPEVMGPPGNMLLCCGPPFNALCPCYACAACCGPCGGPGNALWACGAPCGGRPEGQATANCFSPFLESGFFAKSSLGWSGIGKAKASGAPATHEMSRA
jgi:NADH dehydrogenase FAD-containing subunit